MDTSLNTRPYRNGLLTADPPGKPGSWKALYSLICKREVEVGPYYGIRLSIERNIKATFGEGHFKSHSSLHLSGSHYSDLTSTTSAFFVFFVSQRGVWAFATFHVISSGMKGWDFKTWTWENQWFQVNWDFKRPFKTASGVSHHSEAFAVGWVPTRFGDEEKDRIRVFSFWRRCLHS